LTPPPFFAFICRQATFKNVFARPIQQGQDKSADRKQQNIGEKRSQQLNAQLNLFVLRRTSAVMQKYLPDKYEQMLFCPLSLLQRKLYRHALNSKDVSTCLRSGAASQALSLILSLRKLCQHPDFIFQHVCNENCSSGKGRELSATVRFTNDDDDEDEIAEKANIISSIFSGSRPFFGEDYQMRDFSRKHSGKVALVDGLLKTVRSNTNDRVVLVSQWKYTLDMLQDLCNKRGYPFIRLDGSTDTNNRQNLVTRFNDPSSKIFVFLLSTKAGGVGLNLIGGNRIILFEPDWNPAHDQQAMARVWRQGQQKKVFIYRLFSTGTIEEKIIQRQIVKVDVSNTVVDQGKGEKNFNKNDLRELFKYDNKCRCDTYNKIGLTTLTSKNKKGEGKVTVNSQWDDYDGSSSLEDDMLRLTLEAYDAALLSAATTAKGDRPSFSSTGGAREQQEPDSLVTFVRVEKVKSGADLSSL
jgi:SNF2 family DNA or RNA helicase